MELHFTEKGVFEAVSTFHEKDIPKAAKFRWDPKGTHASEPKRWWTPDVEKANALREYASPECVEVIDKMLEEKQESLEASRATDADIEIPAPKDLDYMPFQRAGIAFASGRPTVLIGDEMGLGKTIQALGVINMDPGVRRVIIVCPASLKTNWRREAEKWVVRPCGIQIIGPDTEFFRPMVEDVQIYIINYDILHKWESTLRKKEWCLLIVDECHYIKNPKARRTQQVYGRWHREKAKRLDPIPAKRSVFLTGTPIVNRPIELWPLVRFAKLFKSWKFYVERYCDACQTRWGWDVSGASNLEELQRKLRETIMVRRLKMDVLTELPPKRRQVIELPASGVLGIVEAERSAWEAHQARIEDFQAAVELAKAAETQEEYDAAVDALREGMRVAFTEMSEVRHDTAVAKVPYVVEHLKSATDGQKVICFAHHHDVIDAIADEFGDACVKLTGRDSQEDRQAAVDRFMSDPSCTLFIGSIMAAGVGLTLTASSTVVFAELDWVPGNLSQAEDRAHRIGQQDSVLVQHLVLEGSLDAEMARRLVEKQEVIDRALDNDCEFDRSKVIELRPKEAATSSTRRTQIEDEAGRLAEEQIQAVHTALRILSGLCDGAQKIDGMGFNKLDTKIGHDLAERLFLTPKQAALGKRIVLKYKRQLGEDLCSTIRGEP